MRTARSSRVSPTNNDIEYLELGDFLLIAEAVLGINAETLLRFERLVPLAESALNAPRAGFGDAEAYPEFAAKAAVLASRIVRNHPLPDGNKRVAYLCLREFVERNGRSWDSASVAETVDAMIRLAAHEISEDEFRAWVEERLV